MWRENEFQHLELPQRQEDDFLSRFFNSHLFLQPLRGCSLHYQGVISTSGLISQKMFSYFTLGAMRLAFQLLYLSIQGSSATFWGSANTGWWDEGSAGFIGPQGSCCAAAGSRRVCSLSSQSSATLCWEPGHSQGLAPLGFMSIPLSPPAAVIKVKPSLGVVLPLQCEFVVLGCYMLQLHGGIIGAGKNLSDAQV